jgi:hypothetical protein
LLVPFPPLLTLEATLDALGTYQAILTPANAVPGLTGVPVHVQFGVYDAPANTFRLSNALIRIYL